MGSKEKTKLIFLRLFDNPLTSILFLKDFFGYDGGFGSFTKIERDSENSFWCKFSAWFFHKHVLYLTLSLWIKFQYHTFFLFQNIKQNVLWRSSLGNLWRHNVKNSGNMLFFPLFKNLVVVQHLAEIWEGNFCENEKLQK